MEVEEGTYQVPGIAQCPCEECRSSSGSRHQHEHQLASPYGHFRAYHTYECELNVRREEHPHLALYIIPGTGQVVPPLRTYELLWCFFGFAADPPSRPSSPPIYPPTHLGFRYRRTNRSSSPSRPQHEARKTPARGRETGPGLRSGNRTIRGLTAGGRAGGIRGRETKPRKSATRLGKALTPTRYVCILYSVSAVWQC